MYITDILIDISITILIDITDHHRLQMFEYLSLLLSTYFFCMRSHVTVNISNKIKKFSRIDKEKRLMKTAF